MTDSAPHTGTPPPTAPGTTPAPLRVAAPDDFSHRARAGRQASVTTGRVSTDVPPRARAGRWREQGRKPAVMTSREPRLIRRRGPQRRPRGEGTAAGDRSAALLVRVWLEDGAQAFRGRLMTTETTPGGRGAETVAVALASSPRDVVEAVRAWLGQFADGSPESMDDGNPRADHRRSAVPRLFGRTTHGRPRGDAP